MWHRVCLAPENFDQAQLLATRGRCHPGPRQQWHSQQGGAELGAHRGRARFLERGEEQGAPGLGSRCRVFHKHQTRVN